MLSRHRYKWIPLSWLLITAAMTLTAQNVTVVVTGIRSPKGQLSIGIFKNETSFQDDTPFLRKIFEKHGISDGQMTVHLSLPPGRYGLALLDDENHDGKMNYSVLGVPKEGFGFSNYYHASLKRPGFDAFAFEIKAHQYMKVVCRMRYM